MNTSISVAFQFLLVFVINTSVYVFWFLFVFYRIKSNVNRGPTFRFVNVIEYIIVGYYDEIKR
mgnify:CR=1 FL=1